MSDFLNSRMLAYVQKNTFEPRSSNNDELLKYQKGLISNVFDDGNPVTPLNNINFAEMVDIGIKSDFSYAAYTLITSLKSEVNKFFIDGDKLRMLFKSNIGITDLPYSLILYFGGLHYFNKIFASGTVIDTLNGKDFYNLPGKLDGEQRLNIILSGELSPSYGYVRNGGGPIAPNIKIVNDNTYRTNCESPFIPKFGYGTLSNFMNNFYNFSYDKNPNNISGYDPKNIDPFHIYGAKKGFVKSFETYNEPNINFMGHYTILKNKANINPDDPSTLKSQFKTLLSNINLTDQTVMTDFFILYSRLKLYYTQNFPKYIGDELKNILKDLTSVQPNYSLYNNISPCSLFSYVIYRHLFGKESSFNLIRGTSINLNDVLTDLGIKDTKLITTNDDVTNIYNFLTYFWNLEKNWLDTNNNPNIQESFTLLLYPSAGGDFNPGSLFNEKFKFGNNYEVLLENRADQKNRDKGYDDYQIIKGSRPFKISGIKDFDKTDFTTPNEKSNFIITNSTDNLDNLYFRNRSVIENATRFLWYDTANDGKQFIKRDKLGTTFASVKNTNITDRFYGLKNLNYFTNIFKLPNGNVDYTINKLDIRELYSVIDIEKLDHFENIFKDFVKNYTEGYPISNNGNYTFISLIKAITTVDTTTITTAITNKNFESFKLGTKSVTQDDLICLLAGYSSFNYHFCATHKISSLINSILTIIQYEKNEGDNGVLNQFLKQKLSLNNYTTIGSVTVKGLEKELYTNYSTFIFRPDVVFSNVDFSNYTSIPENVVPYYLKKLIFGDIELITYKLVKDNVVEEFVLKYLPINRRNKQNFVYDAKHVTAITQGVFRYLNIEFSETNFKMLHSFILSFLNETNRYDVGLLTYTNVMNAMIEVNSKELLVSIYKSSIEHLNRYMIEMAEKLKPSTTQTTTNQTAKITQQDLILDLKVKTYYNIKNIYDRYLSYQGETTPIKEKFPDVQLISENGQLGKNNGMLFYNYLHKDKSLDEWTKSGGVPSKFNNWSPKHLVEYLQIVDRANRDVGNRLLVNIIELGQKTQLNYNIESDNTDLLSKSVYSIFDVMSESNDFLLHPINSYVDRLSVYNKNTRVNQYADTLFGLHTNLDRVDSNPSFIMQWIDHSSNLDSKINGATNKVLSNSFALDINPRTFSLIDENNVPDDIKQGKVTSFVVDFTNKNQNMFKNIQLDTSQFANTEESINVMVNMVAGEANKANIMSGNLRRMIESRSYTCQVESIGNGLIQPLMYFYLKNVPLFNGAYWITNVDHKISPNNMVTTFKGVRQPITTKTTNEKDIINQIKTTIQNIQKSDPNAVINTETIGEITQVREGSAYGQFWQQTNTGYVPSYDGIDILSSFINSEFGSSTELYKIFTTVLYNRAKYHAYKSNQNITPSNVIKYMVEVALTLKANNRDYECKPYFDVDNPKNKKSLSYLIDTYKVPVTNSIYVLLSDLSKAKDNEVVYNLLKPQKLRENKLSVSDKSGIKGQNIFTNAVTPLIKNKGIVDVTNYTEFWKSEYVVYMKNIQNDPNNKEPNTIYDILVNNEDIYEYILLNGMSVDDLNIGQIVANDYVYLGSFGESQITFFGKVYNGTLKDNYGIDIVNNSPLTLYKIHNPDVTGGNGNNIERTKNRLAQLTMEQPSFATRLERLGKDLRLNPFDLARIMNVESGIRAKAQFNDGGKNLAYRPFITINGVKYSAHGLIQFVEDTAKGLGTNTQALYNMSETEQLKYVQKFLEASKYFMASDKSLFAIYMTIFVGGLPKNNDGTYNYPDNYILTNSKGDPYAYYNANPYIAKFSTATKDGKGVIDIATFKKYVQNTV